MSAIFEPCKKMDARLLGNVYVTLSEAIRTAHKPDKGAPLLKAKPHAFQSRSPGSSRAFNWARGHFSELGSRLCPKGRRTLFSKKPRASH